MNQTTKLERGNSLLSLVTLRSSCTNDCKLLREPRITLEAGIAFLLPHSFFQVPFCPIRLLYTTEWAGDIGSQQWEGAGFEVVGSWNARPTRPNSTQWSPKLHQTDPLVLTYLYRYLCRTIAPPGRKWQIWIFLHCPHTILMYWVPEIIASNLDFFPECALY